MGQFVHEPHRCHDHHVRRWSRDSGFGFRDLGFRIRDSGFGFRDSVLGIRDSSFGMEISFCTGTTFRS